MIVTTSVKYRYGIKSFIHYKFFRQYVAENGNKMYMVDDKIVDKATGNEMFNSLLKQYPQAEVKTAVTNENDREIIDGFKKRIDTHTQYIDDYEQQKAREAENDKFRDIINYFDSLSR